jgi:hypothetical protein
MAQRSKHRWIVRFGTSVHMYYTEHHAEQFMRALRLNGTEFTVEVL